MRRHPATVWTEARNQTQNERGECDHCGGFKTVMHTDVDSVLWNCPTCGTSIERHDPRTDQQRAWR